jgi:MFS family permease
MIFSRKNSASSRVFYGWYVLATCFFLGFFQSGALFSFGIMFKPMIAELGWDRASISLVFFLNMVCFALTMSVAGRLYDRFGPRWVIVVATTLLAAGYLCTAGVQSIWQFHIFYGILTAMGSGGASIPLIAALTSKWFAKGRGLAISLALAGTCLGQFFMTPVINWFVLSYGWRLSYALIAFVILLGNTLPALIVLRGDPDDMGLRPYGSNRLLGAATPAKEPADSLADAKSLNLLQAMKTRAFWFFILFMFICGSGDFLVVTHLVPFVTDYGVSPTAAANLMAWFGLFSMGGILIAGPVSDRVGNKIPIALTFLLRIMLFVMIIRYRNPASFFIFAAGFGFTFLITALLNTTLTGRLYGLAHVGVITGFISTIHHLGGGFWAYMGGVLFDETGSYQIILVLSALLAIVAAISSLLIKEKRIVPEEKN